VHDTPSTLSQRDLANKTNLERFTNFFTHAPRVLITHLPPTIEACGRVSCRLMHPQQR
jgi:hypothetical protein